MNWSVSHDSNTDKEKLAEIKEFVNKMLAFQPKGELGPLHGAGMAFAYTDAANHISSILNRGT